MNSVFQKIQEQTDNAEEWFSGRANSGKKEGTSGPCLEARCLSHSQPVFAGWSMWRAILGKSF